MALNGGARASLGFSLSSIESDAACTANVLLLALPVIVIVQRQRRSFETNCSSSITLQHLVVKSTSSLLISVQVASLQFILLASR